VQTTCYPYLHYHHHPFLLFTSRCPLLSETIISHINMAFIEAKLTDASRFIRLFKIDPEASCHGRLSLTLTEHKIADTIFDEQEGTHYTALSYMWGPPEPQYEIQVNQRSFHLRENLYQFLSNLTASEQRSTYWADAVCIYPDRYRTKYCRNLRVNPLIYEGVFLYIQATVSWSL
jgi:hypothetical protein